MIFVIYRAKKYPFQKLILIFEMDIFSKVKVFDTFLLAIFRQNISYHKS